MTSLSIVTSRFLQWFENQIRYGTVKPRTVKIQKKRLRNNPVFGAPMPVVVARTLEGICSVTGNEKEEKKSMRERYSWLSACRYMSLIFKLMR
jgi:hypothetical protein